MTNDQAILAVIGSAIALVRAEDALDRRWTPECAAVVEDRTAQYVRKVKNLVGNTETVTPILVLTRSILREVDAASLRAICVEIAEMLD